ncbi:MAG TPA: glycosyltransferase [Candidatus Krumholzibacteria bacterium]|nr:glycosyltransferase [Candidatus Krumholzibacteria bacterium]
MSPGNAAPALVVVQSVQRWLPQTETWLYTQVTHLPSDIESHVACTRTEHIDQFPFPRIHALMDLPGWRHIWDRAMRRLGVRNHLQFLYDVTRRTHARVLHSHFGFVGWRDMGVSRGLGIAHVVTFYGADVLFYPTMDPRWHGRYREMFAEVDAVLCEGPVMGRSIVALGCPDKKVQIHHLGIDLSLIPFEPRTWTPGQPLRVLMAGSFREKKGFPYAVEALAQLRRKMPLEITIIGDQHGEPRTIREKEKIVAAVARGELSDCTRMLGYQPYRVVMEEARRHHVFMSPSVTAADGDTEGGAPVSLIEMSASGMMIVSTTHCDIPGVILHGKTGWLAPERDVHALLAHLEWIVEHPQDWIGMQRAGRAHVEAEFDAGRQGQRLAAIYRELAARRAGERVQA